MRTDPTPDTDPTNTGTGTRYDVGTVYDLGRALEPGIPCSPNHPGFRMALQRRHGDMVRADGGSAANELIVLGAHVGTHIDALCHVSHDGLLHGGHSAADAQQGGRFSVLGAETIAPIVTRGVLLDVAALHGVEALEPGQAVTGADLAAAADRARVTVDPGDVVLIRTGWGRYWDRPDDFIGATGGVPGPDLSAAEWLVAHRVAATGAETIAFEQIKPGAGHATLPVHRVLLVEHGIHIIEVLDLDALGAAAVHDFLFILSPLKLVGATGSPVRPLAVVP